MSDNKENSSPPSVKRRRGIGKVVDALHDCLQAEEEMLSHARAKDDKRHEALRDGFSELARSIATLATVQEKQMEMDRERSQRECDDRSDMMKLMMTALANKQ